VQRVIESQGVINSMGFPNNGVDALKIRRGAAKVGINIGKSKEHPRAGPKIRGVVPAGAA
jgi:dihydroorotate dehydrogenase